MQQQKKFYQPNLACVRGKLGKLSDPPQISACSGRGSFGKTGKGRDWKTNELLIVEYLGCIYLLAPRT